MKSRLLPKSPAFGVVGLALVAGYFLICGSPGGVNRRVAGLHREDSSSVASLDTLLTLPSSCLIQVDIASMNLLCAEALPGPGGFDLNACLARLDEMAARVRAETGRHAYRFQKNPAEYENSEGFFRMVMLAVVLAEDFGVRYAPGKMGTVAAARADDGFFADARYVFLHGLVRGDVQSPKSEFTGAPRPPGPCTWNMQLAAGVAGGGRSAARLPAEAGDDQGSFVCALGRRARGVQHRSGWAGSQPL